MPQNKKLIEKVLSGRSDANIDFNDLLTLLRSFHFDERIRGSHHIFTLEGVEEILNLQPTGAKAKVYQVRQVRKVMLKYRWGETL
jgi:hypothetical protein